MSGLWPQGVGDAGGCRQDVGRGCGDVMDAILTAVLSGVVIGAIVTGLFSLEKP